MSRDQFTRRRGRRKGETQERWSDLSDDDHTDGEVQPDRGVGRSQKRYYLARDEAGRELEEWSRRPG